MKKLAFGAAFVFAAGGLVAFDSRAASTDDGGWINRIDVERMVPPPPPRGSRTEQDEIAEIHKFQARATPEAMAAAKHDNDVEDATIFANVIGPGWNLSRLPKTNFLIGKIMDVDRPDSGSSKRYYHRARPWIIDPTIQTCAKHEDGPALNSYPSGHAMLGFELGVVLASLIPDKAQAILARAAQYGENRIVCGFHYRSDVTAAQQYGTVLAVEMLQHPRFNGWFLAARAELIAAHITAEPARQ
jgi:acid phosphatase (class A)